MRWNVFQDGAMHIGMMSAIAECHTDWSRTEFVELPVQILEAQFTYALALGYEATRLVRASLFG